MYLALEFGFMVEREDAELAGVLCVAQGQMRRAVFVTPAPCLPRYFNHLHQLWV